jgi:hypothetical protein
LNSELLDQFVKRKGASTPVLTGFLGVWGEMQQSGPRGG